MWHHGEAGGKACMPEQYQFLVGIDWATEVHQVCVMNADREVLEQKEIKALRLLLLRIEPVPPEVTDYVGQMFAQLSEIQFFRNRLTHYHTGRWFRKPGQFVNSDMEVSREPEKSVTLTFGHEALDAARHDLHAITSVMGELFAPDVERFPLVLPAWQYKPSMLTR